MKANTPELMKFKRLQRRLKTSVAELCGLLELLWISTAKNAPQGDIGKFSNEDIAIGCYYDGNPDEFVAALIECGWLDEDPDHRLLVHDWCDHAPRWVVGNLKRYGRSIIVTNPKDRSKSTEQPAKEVTKQPAKEATRQPAIGPSSKPSQVKPSQAKCVSSELLSRHTHSQAFVEAWQSWKNHQAENMNRITPTAEEASLMELVRSLPEEADQIAAIQFSIARRAKHLITNGDHRRAREPPASAKNVSDDDLYSKIGKI